MKTGFKAIAGDNAAILILGSFPSVRSWAEGQYYAHPRNLFWDMMDKICGAGRHHTYEERCEILISNRIAVWDVLLSCDRKGSSDGRIKGHIVNDFDTFFSSHTCHTIFFNGNMAFKMFTRNIDSSRFNIRNLIVLPSTSPANAGITMKEKLVQWGKVAEYI